MMEAAAKTVKQLSQQILPDRPHHLSFDPAWRYRPHADDSRRFEEWHSTRLQYMTLVSEADRGVLLTRPYFDMREDPPKPVPKDVNALAKGSEKKKLSLSDYKNKKSGAPTSSQETTVLKPQEAERPNRPASDHPSTVDPPTDSRRRDDTGHPQLQDAPTQSRRPAAPGNLVDMSLPPKPPTKGLPLGPTSPDTKKRVRPQADDEPRLQKRSKPEGSVSVTDASRNARDDMGRRKDREGTLSKSSATTKDGRSTLSSSLPNGRNQLKDALGTSRHSSPSGHSRGNSVNGIRQTGSGSHRGTPAKADAETPSSKANVPPLLSPLALRLEEDPASLSIRAEKQGRQDNTNARVARSRYPDNISGSKRKQSPIQIPPLLSPTLPSDLDEELRYMELEASNKHQDESDSSGHHERRSARRSDDQREAKRSRASFIVKLKIPKGLRPNVRRILAMEPRKDASRREPPDKPEQGQAPTAGKRPPASNEAIQDSIAVKRPRTAEGGGSSLQPSTPSKGASHMSRVSSTNSQTRTPGDAAANKTPSAPPSSERLTNGVELSKEAEEKITRYRAKEATLVDLGRRLKHDGDLLKKTKQSKARGADGQAHGDARPSESDSKRGYVLHIESAIAFMSSFLVQNEQRALQKRVYDTSTWQSLFPFMASLLKEMRRSELPRCEPPIAVLLLLQSVAMDELGRAHTTYGNPKNHFSADKLVKLQYDKLRLQPQLRDANASIGASNLRIDAPYWATFEDVAEQGLRVLRRWCADEGIKGWTPEVNIKELGLQIGRK